MQNNLFECFNDLIFDEKEHKYYLNSKEIPSVTTIMKKVFGDFYAGVNKSVIERAAEKGKIIHKEIEKYVKNGEFGFTDELDAFKEFCLGNGIRFTHSEQKVYGEINGMWFAGTFDLYDDSNLILADAKTTSVFDTEKTAIQLSFYEYALNQKEIQCKEIIGLHFKAEKCIKKPLNPSSLELLTEILTKYYAGEKMENPLQTLDCLGEITTQKIAEFIEIEKQFKVFEEKKKEFQETLKQEMIKHRIKNADFKAFKIVYIEPSEKETFDTKKFKAEHPELLEDYLKISKVSDSIRITFAKE